MIDFTRVLTASEIGIVLTELHRKRRRANTRQNNIVFRLSTCVGLRVSEIVGINLDNVKTESGRPHIVIPKAIAKNKHGRKVPLFLDAGTLAEITAWKTERLKHGATCSDPFICSLAKHTFGKRLIRRNAQNRWKVAIKILGKERVEQLSIHSGRHSFISHCLNRKCSLINVRDWAGHKNLSTTNQYAHSVDDGEMSVGNLFDFAK